jgi:ubiquinone biosynthesis protein
LVKLQDSVKPFSRIEALAILERALKRPIRDVFADFPAEPIASASVAQVYRTRLKINHRAILVGFSERNKSARPARPLRPYYR